MNRLCHFVLLFACACSGSSAPPAPTSSARAAIVGGTPSDASQDFVLVIANLIDANGLECNAELVAPNLVVTARHCVAKLDETQKISCAVAGGSGSSPTATGDYDPAHFSFATDEMLTHRIDVHAIRIIDSGDAKLCGNDIAYVVLDQDVATLPVAEISLDPVAQGDVVTVVGSGNDQSGNPTATRMQRSDVTVLGVGPTAITVGAIKEGVSDGEFGTTVAFCNGDSGGPALDASGHVTGLVSRTPSCTAGPDVFTSVAAHLDIAQQAFAAAGVAMPGTDAGADAAGDAGDVPLPSSSCSTSPSKGNFLVGWLVALVSLLTVARRRSATGSP